MTEIYYCKQEITKQQFKILVVDDDIHIAETFGEILKNRGHSVTIVTEGIECINKCQNTSYDIIFIDFHLKNDKYEYDETNGAEITDLLKTVCSVNCIVFAITGDDSVTAIKKFKTVGMDGALIKPFDIRVINNLMNSLELRFGKVDKKIIKTIKYSQIKKNVFIFE